MSDTHDDGRPDAERQQPHGTGGMDAAPAHASAGYAPASYAPASYPPASYPPAGYPGSPDNGALPPHGYGMVLLPHQLRPLPPHIDPAWRLAGVGRRAAGRILDQVVFGFVGAFSTAAFIIPLQGMAQGRITELQLSGDAADDMLDSYSGGAVLAVLISLVSYLLIASWWLGRKGTTPGKAMVGIRVQRFSAPGMLGFGRALLRGVVQNAFVLGSILTVWLPYASVGWDSQHLLRGWHDLAADDVVLARRTEPFPAF